MVSINKINSSLKNLAKRVPITSLGAAAKAAVDGNTALKFSTLGKSVGQIESGIKALTQELDYPGSDLVAGVGIIQLTADVPGLTADLVSKVEAEGSALSAIVGGAGVGDGFLFTTFGSSSTEAIQGMLGGTTGKSINQLSSVMKGFTTPDLAKSLESALTIPVSLSFGKALDTFQLNINLEVGTSINKVLQNVVDKLDGSIAGAINNLAGGKLKADQIAGVMQLVSDLDYKAAISTVSLASTLPFAAVEKTMLGLDTSITGRVSFGAPFGEVTLPIASIGANAAGWAGVDTITSVLAPRSTNPSKSAPANYEFSTVASVEELEADFKSATRDITEVVVHWAATYIDQDIGAAEIHQWHIQRGFSGIGYHYVIRRNGTVERGRPINQVGAHALANGHNEFSIGVSFAAGYNCLSGTPNADRYVNAGSINSDQAATLDKFMKTFYKVFPGGQAWGHNDTDPTQKLDPGFSIPEYVSAKFGKKNTSPDGLSAPLSVSALAQYV